MKQGWQPAGTQSPRFAPKARRPPCSESKGVAAAKGAELTAESDGRLLVPRSGAQSAPESRRHLLRTVSLWERASQTAAAFAHRQTFAAPARACGSGIRAGVRPHGLRPFRGAGAARAHKKTPTAFKSNRVIKNRPLEAVGFRLYFIRRPRFLRHPHPSEELQQF